MAVEPSFPEAPEPDPPTPEELERMRAHRRGEHDQDFDARRDVSNAGNPSEMAPLEFTAATPVRGPSFTCRECPGSVFVLPDPYIGTPERRAYLRRSDAKLRTLLAGVDPGKQDRFIDRYEQRRLGAWLAVVAPGHGEPPGRSPVVAGRIERCQAFLLKQRFAGRTIADAIDDLRDLHETNRRLYCEIVGDARLYEAETFHGYYKELPAETKAAAAEACEQLRASGKAKPKYGNEKFTG